MPKLPDRDYTDELWRRGKLDYKLYPEQMLMEKGYIDRGKKLFVINCSRRLGKTYWLVKKAVEVAITCPHPLPRIKIASSLKSNLTELIIPAFQMLFDDAPTEVIPGWSKMYKKQDSKIVFPNGAEIKLVGLDKDPEGLRGTYANWIGVDEAGMVKNLQRMMSSVLFPLTQNMEDAAIVLASTPSVTPAHDYQGYCINAKKEGNYLELDIHNNSRLSAEDIEHIRVEECATESDWFREYMCQFVIDTNLAICPEFEKNQNTIVKEIEKPSYYKHLHKFMSLDLGTKMDLTAILLGFYDPLTDHLYIQEEADINGPEMTSNKLVKLMRTLEEKTWGRDEPHLRIADNDNPLLVQDLNLTYDMYTKSAKKDHVHAGVTALRDRVKQGKITISPKCTMLAGSLLSGVWNSTRQKFERMKPYGHFDHLASLVIMIRNMDTSDGHIPPDVKYNIKKLAQSDFVRPGGSVKTAENSNNLNSLFKFYSKRSRKK